MSDKMRWRFGDTNPVQASVRPETIIEIGDLLWLDEWFAEPFQADRSFDGHSQFLGVAMQRSQKGEQTPIRVSTTGTFEFDCEPTICLLGDRIAIKRETANLPQPGHRCLHRQIGSVVFHADNPNARSDSLSDHGTMMPD